jgi:hydrogenase 3 maturation protease
MDDFKSDVNRLFAGNACSKIAILGIGNELRRDDAVGLAVVDRLNSFIGDPSVVVLNCQHVPENFTGYVKRIRPTCVVLVDAADFGALPGEARIFQLNDLEVSSVTTHKASLLALGEYLQSEINCNIFVIGIQPADCDFGSGLSPIAQRASIVVADLISTAINRIRERSVEVITDGHF